MVETQSRYYRLCVILFTGEGEGGFRACITGHTTRGGSTSRGSASRALCIWERSASGGGLHGGGGVGQPPPALQDTVNKRAVHILLECIVVKNYDDLSLPYNKESNQTHLYTV